MLPVAIQKFLSQSQLKYQPDKFIYHTLRNITLGLLKQAPHDIWVSGEDEIDQYLLARPEFDSDGEAVYSAYQFWIKPELRSLERVRKTMKFLRFYAQKQGFKRLYITTSRTDKIQAYSRGLGKDFKLKTVTFIKEL